MMTYWLNTFFNLFGRFLDNLFENWYLAPGIGFGNLFLYTTIAILLIKFVFNIKVSSGFWKPSMNEKMDRARQQGSASGYLAGYVDGNKNRFKN